MDLKLRLAHKLQFHMLPRDVPPESLVTIAAVLESYCHLSGDLFGWETLPDGRFLLWILDLAGHGVQAGLASAVLKVILERTPERGRLGTLVGRLSESLAACVREPFTSLFATGFFIVIEPDGAASYVSAGHPPMLVRSRERYLRELRSNALPIGMFPEREYPVKRLRLAPGETLLLYTDGVVEAESGAGEPFGLDRLRKLLRTEFDAPEQLTGRFYERLAGHQDMDRLADDVTIVAATLGPALAGRPDSGEPAR
jgi:serine phosphatase RsbU (regulator of sigma subunit)